MIAMWVVMVLAAIVVFAIFGIVLFRKVLALMLDVSDLFGRTAILDGVHRAEPFERPIPAVLAGVAEPAARWRALRTRARERRATRRAAAIDRGRALVRADATSISWFHR